jgi:hypothetical protein
MARWQDVEDSAPDFAKTARQLFDAHRHKVLATLRHDGSPRVSGIEAGFTEGEIWVGMMPGSRKLADVRRDPRLALHSGSEDPPEDPTAWGGDAKLAGRAVPVVDPAERGRLLGAAADASPEGEVFRIDISEVAVVRVGEPADHLVIQLWRPGEGLRRMTRR